MAWRVEILNEAVVAEIAALPADMQARFLRLAERIVSAGLDGLGEPHVKHLEGKLWELRRRVAMELRAHCMSRPWAAGWSWFAIREENAKDAARRDRTRVTESQ